MTIELAQCLQNSRCFGLVQWVRGGFYLSMIFSMVLVIDQFMGKMLQLNGLSATEHKGVFYEILQFTDIARKVVPDQDVECVL